MDTRDLITAVAVTVAVISFLFNLIGKRDPVMMKLLESMIKNVTQDVEYVHNDVKKSQVTLDEIVRRLDAIEKRLES